MIILIIKIAMEQNLSNGVTGKKTKKKIIPKFILALYKILEVISILLIFIE
jgi:hypothetical protein